MAKVAIDEEINFDENLTDFLGRTAYVGFDPKHIRNLVEKKELKLSIIAKAIAFGLNRGTNLDNIIKKTSEEGRSEIRKLVQAIGLVSTGDDIKSDISLPVNRIDKDSITLPRLMAAFPVLTCTLNCKPDIRKIPVDTTLHSAFQWFGAGSVIPKGHPDMALWESWYRAADKIINAKKLNSRDPSQYITIIKRSSILSDEERSKYHKALKERSH